MNGEVRIMVERRKQERSNPKPEKDADVEQADVERVQGYITEEEFRRDVGPAGPVVRPVDNVDE